MKTIVTHKNPHLDEIVCVWMVRTFLPGWAEARLKFIPTNPKGGAVKNPDKDPNVMHIGVGRGKFDEHKGDTNDSATTLVYKYIFREKKIKLSPVENNALAELVAYADAEDHGKFIEAPRAEFSIAAAMANLSKMHNVNSTKITEFGVMYLHGVYSALLEKHALERDWKKSIAFATKWGKGVALQTNASAKVLLRRAAQDGAVIAVAVNPENKFRSIRALNSANVDLTPQFAIVHAAEPQAEWYLHQSKKMLICGSDVASNIVLSDMPLKKLIALIAV